MHPFLDGKVNNDKKLGGSLVDTGIAGQRTMISYRPNLIMQKLLFSADGVGFNNAQIAPFKK